jgi:hypothetical protein
MDEDRVMETNDDVTGASADGRWRNIITGECRDTPPAIGELDWIEGSLVCRCPD